MTLEETIEACPPPCGTPENKSMPYIRQSDRPAIDAVLVPLIKQLASHNFVDGELNYVITSLVLAAFKSNRRYAEINKLMGVLECVKAEFYRRHAGPYEDEKRIENGDVT